MSPEGGVLNPYTLAIKRCSPCTSIPYCPCQFFRSRYGNTAYAAFVCQVEVMMIIILEREFIWFPTLRFSGHRKFYPVAVQNTCRLPCGAPCDRLPCDYRCPKLLDCGHQCSSVCGERCPSQKFCAVCGDPKKEVRPVEIELHLKPTLLWSQGV